MQSILNNRGFKTDEVKVEDSERQPCEMWGRMTGYFRPVSEFNIGKKSEYSEMVCFWEGKAIRPDKSVVNG